MENDYANRGESAVDPENAMDGDTVGPENATVEDIEKNIVPNLRPCSKNITPRSTAWLRRA
ncbi:hypothetical protein IT084_15930 [Desulfallas sp. Bu1-1]|uniref:hypothetical protein n=1 Tax=Desulfallas sp. Bu1-1 TaxID=2787620 RepID=UPI00189DAEF8|nr:hypothetical protein [Desulfallas sp. Bu1-1]MBF7084441.1 hypothetical protein [Desulfallas sp. Bu1-1]